MKPKRYVITFAAFVGVALLAHAIGLVALSYPQPVENEALFDPVAVELVDGNTLVLADGRLLAIEPYVKDLAQTVRESGGRVDLDKLGVVYVSQRGWLCGTPWAAPVRVPLFADEVPINRRKPIGLAIGPANQINDRR